MAFMDFHGLHCFPWISLNINWFHGLPWISWISWIPIDFHGFPRISMDISWNSWLRKLNFRKFTHPNLGFSKIQTRGAWSFRKSRPPEAWIFENPGLRRYGFSKIQASGSLDFRSMYVNCTLILENPWKMYVNCTLILENPWTVYVNCTLILENPDR